MDIALFSPSPLFANDDGEDASVDEEKTDNQQSYEERRHQFPAMELLIREFSFHQLNANLLWPGTFAFAEWLVQHQSWIEGRRCLELGSGTGALAIFLQKSFDLDITTSDYDDQEITDNIAHNCQANGIMPVLPHIKLYLEDGICHILPISMGHAIFIFFIYYLMLRSNICLILGVWPDCLDSWGDTFPIADPDWDLIIASDILLYVKQYLNLIKSLSYLLKSYKPKGDKVLPPWGNEQSNGTCMGLPTPAFLMSWKRRIGKEDESLFFSGCENAGLEVKHLGSRVYCIRPRENTEN